MVESRRGWIAKLLRICIYYDRPFCIPEFTLALNAPESRHCNEKVDLKWRSIVTLPRRQQLEKYGMNNWEQIDIVSLDYILCNNELV